MKTDRESTVRFFKRNAGTSAGPRSSTLTSCCGSLSERSWRAWCQANYDRWKAESPAPARTARCARQDSERLPSKVPPSSPNRRSCAGTGASVASMAVWTRGLSESTEPVRTGRTLADKTLTFGATSTEIVCAAYCAVTRLPRRPGRDSRGPSIFPPSSSMFQVSLLAHAQAAGAPSLTGRLSLAGPLRSLRRRCSPLSPPAGVECHSASGAAPRQPRRPGD
jgi:hypothetical protein